VGGTHMAKQTPPIRMHGKQFISLRKNDIKRENRTYVRKKMNFNQID
jgi:hypothetical protein